MAGKRANWKKRAAIAAAVGLGAAALFGGPRIKRHIDARFAAESTARERARVVLVESRLVNDPNSWARLSRIYNWNPKNANDAAKIRLLESISRKTVVSPSRKTVVSPVRVLLTIEQNRIDSTQVKALQNNVAVKREALAKALKEAASATGPRLERAKENAAFLKGEIARLQRVAQIIDLLLAEKNASPERRIVVEQTLDSIRKRSSLPALRHLAAQEDASQATKNSN